MKGEKNEDQKIIKSLLDIDIYNTLAANPHLNHSQWINDIVRKHMENNGLLPGGNKSCQ